MRAGDVKYMLEQRPELGAKQLGKILRLSSVTEHDTSLSLGTRHVTIVSFINVPLGYSLKDSAVVAKIFHTDDEELDDKTHKLYIEFEKGRFFSDQVALTN